MLHILISIVLWSHGAYAKTRSTTSTAYTGFIQTASSTDVEIKLPTVLPKKKGKLNSIYSLKYLLTSLPIRYSNSGGNSRYVSEICDSCSIACLICAEHKSIDLRYLAIIALPGVLALIFLIWAKCRARRATRRHAAGTVSRVGRRCKCAPCISSNPHNCGHERSGTVHCCPYCRQCRAYDPRRVSNT